MSRQQPGTERSMMKLPSPLLFVLQSTRCAGVHQLPDLKIRREGQIVGVAQCMPGQTMYFVRPPLGQKMDDFTIYNKDCIYTLSARLPTYLHLI